MPIFEIRLSGGNDESLFFETVKADAAEAAQHAQLLLRAHDAFERAEIWNGLKCVKVIEP